MRSRGHLFTTPACGYTNEIGQTYFAGGTTFSAATIKSKPAAGAWGRFETILGLLWAILGHHGAILGPTWDPLGASLCHVGAILGPFFHPVQKTVVREAAWSHLGAILGPCGAIMGPSLKPSRGHLGLSGPSTAFLGDLGGPTQGQIQNRRTNRFVFQGHDRLRLTADYDHGRGE